MQTLIELLPRMRALGGREALRYHNGYRTWRVSYSQLYSRIGSVARYLDQCGFRKGDRVLLWGENRPEWVYIFWASIARGVEVVPLDYRFSSQLVSRIQKDVSARLLVAGDEVDASDIGVEQISFTAVADLVRSDSAEDLDIETAGVSASDVVEIVYTSGTTGEPKGVVHRHSNIASNLSAIQKEIQRYLWLARPFQPIRMLDLLPLSHMFGQSTALFVPVMLEGAVVFTSDLSPGGLIETARRERVSVVIGVPRMLSNLRQEIERGLMEPVRRPQLRGIRGVLESWLRYRRVHARLGWKFWAFVVGGAQLGRELEDFWRWLGYVVVQGYGLTEASPVIAVNHPFHVRRGSIGAAIAGQEIRLGPDGEILVRGPSIVNEYFARPRAAAGSGEELGAETAAGRAGLAEESRVRDESNDGWLHTGDIGELDAEGHLYYRGRKKEMIVRPDGLNVYPQDVETVLNSMPGVHESVVVAVERNSEERIHAAVIPEQDLEDAPRQLEAAVRRANDQLESHQRIQSWSLWPEEDFPRTASTMKVRRAEVAKLVAAEQAGRQASHPARASGLEAMLAEITGRDVDAISGDQRLEADLGITSLERVELLAQIESHYNVELEEERFAAVDTVGELQAWLRETGGGRLSAKAEDGAHEAEAAPPREAGTAEPRTAAAETNGEPQLDLAVALSETSEKPAAARPMRLESTAPAFLTQPRWTRWLPVRLLRARLLDLAILPMVRELVRLKARGLENLSGLEPPVIFAANHSSHFDTAVLYAALPRRWRRRVTPAMSQDFFRPLFERHRFPPEEFGKAAGQFALACGLFNAYPLPQKMGGARRALRYTGELIDRGYCPLVFPEGERTPTGRMLPFKSGIGLMARRLGVPIVPVYLAGVYEVYSMHHEWPAPGRVVVSFGRPLRFEANGDYLEAARVVEAAVRALAGEDEDRERGEGG
ncbi:MAG: AMP-binding protein [Bryobacterales bacterium]